MTERATQFLIRLGTDPRALAAFKSNPEKTLEESDLSPAEKTLILSGDPLLIQKSLVSDPALEAAVRNSGIEIPTAETVVVVVIVLVIV
ncbi:hypothetical protein [Streptomyces sp. NPDC090994]|uniref:hypothetical protein n=1 Tax=Streptomyces sp. NPDC090994 TaxID=3365969 RepID=UPI0038196887